MGKRIQGVRLSLVIVCLAFGQGEARAGEPRLPRARLPPVVRARGSTWMEPGNSPPTRRTSARRKSGLRPAKACRGCPGLATPLGPRARSGCRVSGTIRATAPRPTRYIITSSAKDGTSGRRPSLPTWAGRRRLLVVTGVHRYAKVWIDHHYAGEQIGYLSQLESDVTDYLAPGRTVTITIQVDSKQRWEVDTMFGTLDLADYMDVAWGGIWGHVYLETRAEASLSQLYVQADVPASACSASAVFCGKGGLADRARLEVSDPGGRAVAKAETPLPTPLADGQVLRLAATIPGVQLWSPDSPALYTARLSILRGETAVDAVESRFGMRPGRSPRPAHPLERQAADASRLRRRPRLCRADGHAGGQGSLPEAVAADQVVRVQPRSPPQRDHAAGVLRRLR